MQLHGTRVALVGLTLATLTLSGCGGDDSLTAKEFRTKASALCTAADKDTDAIGKNLSDSSTEAEITSAIDKLVDRNEKLVKDLDALKAPDSLADDVDAMLDSVRAALKKLDDASMAELNEMENPFTDADAKAKKIGLDACAN